MQSKPFHGPIEELERRTLLSASLTATDIAGPTFTGKIHLRYHAAAGIAARPSVAPVSLQFSSLSNSVLSGAISADAQGSVNFSGPANAHSFNGVFADGSIAGRFSANETSVRGHIREMVDGEIITGHYRASDRVIVTAASKRAAAAESTPLNFIAGAGTTVNAISAANGVSASTVRPTEQVSLPALVTAFISPDELNGTTTADGLSASELSLSSSIEATPTFVGSMTATPGASITVNGGTGNSINTFSSSSGIISILNSGSTFTSSSGVVSITAPPTFSPSSGLGATGFGG